jgi:hypothetical protein
MRAIYVGEAILSNTDQVEEFLTTREPAYDYLYVCSPEFFMEGGKQYYNVRVRMYQRTKDNGRSVGKVG